MGQFDLEIRPFFFSWLLCSGIVSRHQKLIFYVGAGFSSELVFCFRVRVWGAASWAWPAMG